MVLVRALLISVLALATSLSGVVSEEFKAGVDYANTITYEPSETGVSPCCESARDAVETSDHMPVLTPNVSDYFSLSRVPDGNRYYIAEVVLTGAGLSGPLKPPRQL